MGLGTVVARLLEFGWVIYLLFTLGGTSSIVTWGLGVLVIIVIGLVLEVLGP